MQIHDSIRDIHNSIISWIFNSRLSSVSIIELLTSIISFWICIIIHPWCNLGISIIDGIINIHHWESTNRIIIFHNKIKDIHDIHQWFTCMIIYDRIMNIYNRLWVCIKGLIHFWISMVALLSSDLAALITWGPFHEQFPFTFRMWWKFHFIVINFLIIRLQQIVRMPQKLSCCVMCNYLHRVIWIWMRAKWNV